MILKMSKLRSKTMEEKKYKISEIRQMIPDFIDDEFPKDGKTGERGAATVALALFACWLMSKEVLKKKGGK